MNANSPLTVIRLLAADGTIVAQNLFSTINTSMQDIALHLLPDNAGYYVFGANGSNRAILCRYLYSTSSIYE